MRSVSAIDREGSSSRRISQPAKRQTGARKICRVQPHRVRKSRMNVFYFGSSMLVEHINQQLQLTVEHRFRIGQGIGSVLSEDL